MRLPLIGLAFILLLPGCGIYRLIFTERRGAHSQAEVQEASARSIRAESGCSGQPVLLDARDTDWRLEQCGRLFRCDSGYWPPVCDEVTTKKRLLALDRVAFLSGCRQQLHVLDAIEGEHMKDPSHYRIATCSNVYACDVAEGAPGETDPLQCTVVAKEERPIPPSAATSPPPPSL